VAALADTAAGFAALTLASDADDVGWPGGVGLRDRDRRRPCADRGVQDQPAAPANGDAIVADDDVLKAGRMLTVCPSRVTLDGILCAIATVALANPLGTDTAWSTTFDPRSKILGRPRRCPVSGHRQRVSQDIGNVWGSAVGRWPGLMLGGVQGPSGDHCCCCGGVPPG